MGKLLDGFPYWSQLRDPSPSTHALDPYATTDCGEECVSIVIKRETREYTWAGQLRLELGPGRTDGRTDGVDLAHLLTKHHVPAERHADKLAGLHSTVITEVEHGRASILLGRWLIPTELHWVVAIGYGNGAMLCMEPWKGELVAYRWQVVHSLATGEVVQLSG